MFTTVTFTPGTTGASAITLHDTTGTAQLTHVEGFVGPPEPRDVVKVLPGRDGALDDTRYVSHRTMVLEGELWGSSITNVWAQWDALASALQTTMLVPGTLTVTRPDGSVRTISVVLTGAAQPNVEGGSPFLQYQINLRAPDPRWYGTTLHTSTISSTSKGAWTSSSNVVNAGNAPTFPLITTADGTPNKIRYIEFAPPTPYVAVNPYGATSLLTSVVIASGDGMQFTTASILDAFKRKVTSLVNPPDSTSEFPILYPGTSTWRFWSESPAAGSTRTLTASWFDAWW